MDLRKYYFPLESQVEDSFIWDPLIDTKCDEYYDELLANIPKLIIDKKDYDEIMDNSINFHSAFNKAEYNILINRLKSGKYGYITEDQSDTTTLNYKMIIYEDS